jgi:hypothetical protein
MDGENLIAPRPDGRYWASVGPEELGSQVLSRFLEYQRDIHARGLLQLWQRIASTHYGYDPATDSLSDWIAAGGEEGELLKLHVNELGSLVRHQLILATSDKLAFDCIPRSDSPEADAQASLGEQLIASYMGDGLLEPILAQSVLRALLFGRSHVVQLWDAYAGPDDVGARVEEVPAYDERGEPMTEAIESEVVEPSPDGLEMVTRVVREERPVMRERVRRAGDIVHRVYSPIDVAHDLGTRTSTDCSWYVIRERIDRWELIARYPEHTATIAAQPAYNRDETSRYERGDMRTGELTGRTDQIHVLRMVHAKTEAMPHGLEALVCGDVCLTPPMPLAYRRLPVHSVCPQEILDSAVGYPEVGNLLGPQAAMNAAAANGITSMDAGSVPKWAFPEGSGVQVDDVAPNMRVVYYKPNPSAPNGGMPQLMQTPELRDTHIRAMDVWRDVMQRLSGVNAVVRGESQGKSGADNALIQAQAMNYMNGVVLTRVLQAQSVGRGIIELMQAFATEERILRVVGDDERPSIQFFTGEDLGAIGHVDVEIAPAEMRTFGMKLELARELADRFPQQVTPEQFLAFIASGRLEPLYKAQRNQVRLIRAENSALTRGEAVPVLIADCHLDHIREHLALLSSPQLRMDPQLAQVVLAHVQEHEMQWQMLSSRPALLAATAQAPAPPPAGPMGPPMEGGPPPDANGPPGPGGPPPGGGDGPPTERASVGGREQVDGVALPQPPRNAATGEPAQINGGMR